jgi:RNA polymerase sigma factor (sigma-70 family)
MIKRYMASDKLLVEGCIKRDIEAWNALVDKYSSLMHASARKRLARHGFSSVQGEEIEDIVQDALTSLWRDEKMASLKNHDSLPYWLSMISQNAAVTYLRKMKRQGISETIPEPEIQDDCEMLEPLIKSTSNPHLDLHNGELRKAIDKAMASLAVNEKLVMKLCLFHGKRYHEISEILSMPQGTVCSLAKRAKEKLQAALKRFLIFFAIIFPFLASYIVGGQK